ncbi:hypothetical protein ACFL4Y_04175, partial [Gemmatimonadota bacterium]
MARTRLCILGASLLLLGGCIQVDMHFLVRSDGSGRLTTRMTMAADSPAAGMAEMGGEMTGTFSEESARQQAAQYGPGVTFVRFREIDDGEITGMEAVYDFENISLVRAAPLSEGEGGMEAATQEVAFLFSPDEGGTLTINLPDQTASEGAPPEEMDEMTLGMQASMMKGMMAGMHIRMAVEIEDGIAEANTRNVRDNVVTVYEIDAVGRIAWDPVRRTMMATVVGQPA